MFTTPAIEQLSPINRVEIYIGDSTGMTVGLLETYAAKSCKNQTHCPFPSITPIISIKCLSDFHNEQNDRGQL